MTPLFSSYPIACETLVELMQSCDFAIGAWDGLVVHLRREPIGLSLAVGDCAPLWFFDTTDLLYHDTGHAIVYSTTLYGYTDGFSRANCYHLATRERFVSRSA